MLQGSKVLSLIEEGKARIKMSYETMVAEVPDFANLCSLTEFIEAVSISKSRSFPMVVDVEDGETRVFLPYLDLMNHDQSQVNV